MTLSRSLAPLAVVIASTAAAAWLAAAAALTLPAAPASLAPETLAPIERVHGCHPGVQRDYAGWHIHSRACVKRPVSPPGLADAPAYRRSFRGPFCRYQCRYVGPVKTCRQVCR